MCNKEEEDANLISELKARNNWLQSELAMALTSKEKKSSTCCF